MDGRIDGCIDEKMDRWKKDRRMGNWMDGWMEIVQMTQSVEASHSYYPTLHPTASPSRVTQSPGLPRAFSVMILNMTSYLSHLTIFGRLHLTIRGDWISWWHYTKIP